MNKIEELAQKRFNGNIEDAIKFMNFNCTDEAKKEFCKEFTEEQHKIYFKLADELIKKQGGLELLFSSAEIQTQLNITRDEIKNAKKNPYAGKVKKCFLIFVVVNVGLAIIYKLADGSSIKNIITITLSTTITTLAYTLGQAVVSYFKFNKVNKMYNSKEVISIQKKLREGKKLSVEEAFGEKNNLVFEE